LKQEQRLLAKILKIWYDEHKQEVTHEAFICLVSSLADFENVIHEEQLDFDKQEFVRKCLR
jgi:hypothetical protein